MTRPLYWFRFDDWYAVPDGHGCIDWDADALCLILHPDGKVETRHFCSQNDQERVFAEFPNAVFMGALSRHRDKLEQSAEQAAALQKDHPDVYADLARWTPFKEERVVAQA